MKKKDTSKPLMLYLAESIYFQLKAPGVKEIVGKPLEAGLPYSLISSFFLTEFLFSDQYLYDEVLPYFS